MNIFHNGLYLSKTVVASHTYLVVFGGISSMGSVLKYRKSKRENFVLNLRIPGVLSVIKL